MTKLSTSIGGLLRTFADKVLTPIVSRSFAAPMGRKDGKHAETESSTVTVEYLNHIP